MTDGTAFETLTKKQKSILLYVESCAVDRRGEIDLRRINQDDIDILNAWDAEGLVDFRETAGLCRLTLGAMSLAAQCRLERALSSKTVLSAEAEAARATPNT